MAFLTTAVPSIQYTTQLLVRPAKSGNSLNVIIDVIDEECCIVFSESFENDLDLPVQ